MCRAFSSSKTIAIASSGGVAVQRWGAPRLTTDVDLTLLTGFGQEEEYVDTLLSFLEPRRPDAREFAFVNRVLLARTPSGINVDVALGALPFEEESIARATLWQWGSGAPLLTCSAEDLMIHKTFAGRPRDWDDVERILKRNWSKLDLDWVRRDLKELLAAREDLGHLDLLEKLLAKIKVQMEGSS